MQWLQSNYNFSYVSYAIDELIVLDVSRGQKQSEEFCTALKMLSEGCFAPIAAGGGVKTIDTARNLLRCGADKVVINSALYEEDNLIQHLAREFGQQCVVASMDIRSSPDGSYQAWSECGSVCQPESASFWIERVTQSAIGELYLNSMDRDGTGQGYDLRLLDLLPDEMSKPLILAGGVGNASHLAAGLADPRVDAVATAHLFNFVGNGLEQARQTLISGGVNLPFWDVQLLKNHLSDLKSQKRQ